MKKRRMAERRPLAGPPTPPEGAWSRRCSPWSACSPGGIPRVSPAHGGGCDQDRGEGMEQGQPGSTPLGDTLHATRHLLTDAVVFDDYTMHEGMVIPSGTIRTRYHPETCPALPQQLARVSRGDTAAALAFVRTYGLLGYAQVAAAVG